MAEGKAAEAFPFENHFGFTGTGTAPSSGASGGGSLSYHPLISHQSLNILNELFTISSWISRGRKYLRSTNAIVRFIPIPEFRKSVKSVGIPLLTPCCGSRTKQRWMPRYHFSSPQGMQEQDITIRDLVQYHKRTKLLYLSQCLEMLAVGL